MRESFISFILTTGFVVFIGSQACTSDNTESLNPENNINHVTVYFEEGKFGGWPANWGIWAWDNEILVSFTKADHMERSGHTFDVDTAINMFARSLDGGETWTLEDAYTNGITGATFEHNLGEKSEPSVALSDAINFEHPDLAFTFRAHTLLDGPSSFYFSYDKGKNWQGPYKLEVDFPNREPVGIVSRTDYIIEGELEMTAFLTVGFRVGDENWREVAAVRTNDGGLTWNFLSWIGPEHVNSIMPSSVRLDDSRLITIIRQHTRPRRITSYISEDNGFTWKQLDDPVQVQSGNPPALLQLQDGRLCFVFGIRDADVNPSGIGMYAVLSSDYGNSWTEPFLIRGGDGANWDIGYPRAIQRPDGKVVTTYYYNHANDPNMPPYRTIEATIFDPLKY